jgi:hypothetical protein
LQRSDEGSVPDFLRSVAEFPNSLVRSIEELFLLRNSLVHNHVWLMRGSSAGGVFTAEAIERLSGREGSATLASADRRKTSRHKFNLVPELVGYYDARKALRILVNALDACAAIDVANMPSGADTTRIEMPDGRKPTLRVGSRMPRR